MKKRLLSAALALAMVLTMLPMSVFAADPPTVGAEKAPDKANTTVYRQMKDDGVRTVGKWYWDEKDSSGKIMYHAIPDSSNSVVSGTSGSGTWYSWDNNYATGIMNSSGALKTTTFTLLDDIDIGTWTGITSLTVNVNDKTLTLADAGTYGIDMLATLNVTNPWGDATSGEVSGITKNVQKSAALSITASNVNLGDITLKNGMANKLNIQGGVTIGELNMGVGITENGKTTYATQTITTSGANVITGPMNIVSGGGTFTLNNITGTNGAKGGALNLTSTGGGVIVAGQSNIDKITVMSTCGGTAANVAVPSVTVNGGTVNGIEHATADKTTASATVTVNGGTVTGTDSIKLNKGGTVNINAGATVSGKVTVPTGALNITGGVSGTTVGAININKDGKTTLKVTGSNVTTGDITADGVSNLTVDIPDNLTNKFGELDLSTYSGQGIKGGKFKSPADNDTGAKSDWFASTVRFYVKDQTDTDYYRYYGENDLAAIINYLGEKAATAANITLVGHKDTKHVTLQNGAVSTKVAKIGFSKVTAFKLPAVLLGDTITKWTLDGTTVSYDPTGTFTIDDATKDYTLLGQDSGLQANASKLRRAEVDSGDNYTRGIRVTLNGNVITLSGAINSDGGMTVIPLELETDVRKNDGTYDTVKVSAVYNSNNKTVTFGMSSAADLGAKGIVLTETTLTMSNGGAVYTLNASGLGKPAGNFDTVPGPSEIQVTVTKSGWNDYQKKALIDKMTDTDSVFTWADAPAMVQAINAAQLTINNPTTVNNWITTAQNAVWRYGNKTGTTGFNGKGDGTLNAHTTNAPTDAQRAAATDLTGKYAAVWLVPYLQVTVTDVNETTGYMTLTLTPSYRVDVSAEAGHSKTEYYTVQTGRSLGAITGDMGDGVKVKFNGLESVFATAWMHQDKAYAYVGDGKEWTITHSSSNGLGSMVIDTTKPLIELKNDDGSSADPALWYDSLQAAVDDTRYKAEGKEDVIAIGGGYGGTGSISVSGDARTFKIAVEGNTLISSSASGDTVKVTGGGHEYTIQLLKNVVPANAASITVTTVTGGSGSLSSSSAQPGSTVTYTPSPSAGYRLSSVSAKTNTGASVSMTANANGTYSFVVPSGATSVTVTPSFVKTTTTTLPFTDVPTTAWYYNGVEYCYNTVRGSARLMQGMSATTFGPNSGFTRAQVVQILWNIKGQPEPTTTYNPYTDISSIHYAYKAMLWATQNGYAEGYVDNGVRTFRPNQNVTRQEMAVFLWRAAGKPTNYNSLNLNAYTDGYMVYDWAQPAMRWAIARGVLSGQSSVALGNYLSPRTVANRSEVAVTVMNFDKLAVFR